MGGNKIDVLRSSCDVFNVRIEQRDGGPGRLSKEILCGSIFSNLYFLLLQRIQFKITDAPDQDQVKTKESYLGDHMMDLISSSSFRLHHFCPKKSSEQLQLYFIDLVPICSPSQSLGSHRKKIKQMAHPLPVPGIGQLCHDVGFCVTVSTPNDSTISPPHKTIVDVWTTHRTSLIIK